MACCGPPDELRDHDDWRYPRTLEWKRLVTGDDVPLILGPSYARPLLPATTVEVPNPLHTRSAQQWFLNLPDDTARAIMNTRRSMVREKKIVDSVFSMNPKPPARDPRPTADMVLHQLATIRQYQMAAAGGGGRRRKQQQPGQPGLLGVGVGGRPGTAPPGPSGTQRMHQMGVNMRLSQPGTQPSQDPALQAQPGGLPPPLSVIIARQQQQQQQQQRWSRPHSAAGAAPGQAQAPPPPPPGKVAGFFRAISPFKGRPGAQSPPPLPPPGQQLYPQQQGQMPPPGQQLYPQQQGQMPPPGQQLYPQQQGQLPPPPQQQPQQLQQVPGTEGAAAGPWYKRMWRRGGSAAGAAPPADAAAAAAQQQQQQQFPQPGQVGGVQGVQPQPQYPGSQQQFGPLQIGTQPHPQPQSQPHYPGPQPPSQFNPQLHPGMQPQPQPPQSQGIQPQPVLQGPAQGMASPYGRLQPQPQPQLQQQGAQPAPLVGAPPASPASPYQTYPQQPQPQLQQSYGSSSQLPLQHQPQQQPYGGQQAPASYGGYGTYGTTADGRLPGPAYPGGGPGVQPGFPGPLQQQQQQQQQPYTAGIGAPPAPLPPPVPPAAAPLPPPLAPFDDDGYGLDTEVAGPPPRPPPPMTAAASGRRIAANALGDNQFGLGADVAEAEAAVAAPPPLPRPAALPPPPPRTLSGSRGSGLLRGSVTMSYDTNDPNDLPAEPLEATAAAAEQRLGFAPPARRPPPPRSEIQGGSGPRLIQIQRQPSLDEPVGEIEDVEEEFGLGAETAGGSGGAGGAAGRPAGLPAARQLAAEGPPGLDSFSFAARDALRGADGTTPQKLRPVGLPTPSKLPPPRFMDTDMTAEDF
ncbi:hypothetical protein PLESTM_000894500 [Pleodorina starrii]|nr:hypothetical protein PLESTM_000894500 [Pleodorina starrii]